MRSRSGMTTVTGMPMINAVRLILPPSLSASRRDFAKASLVNVAPLMRSTRELWAPTASWMRYGRATPLM